MQSSKLMKSLTVAAGLFGSVLSFRPPNSASTQALHDSLAIIRNEYKLIPKQSISLASLFINHGLDPLESFGSSACGHTHNQEIVAASAAWSKKHGIWSNDKDGFNHVTMGAYLYPNGEFQKVMAATNLFCWNYYVDDELDLEDKSKSSAERESAVRDIQRMLALLNSNTSKRHETHAGATISHYESSLLEVLNGLNMAGCHPTLQGEIEQELSLHLETLLVSSDTIHSVEEYVRFRRRSSGMRHTILLGKFCNVKPLDREFCKAIGACDLIADMEDCVADFAGLSNDLFSFEKEIIGIGSTHNLLFHLMHHSLAQNFHSVIEEGARIVTRLPVQYAETKRSLEAVLKDCPDDPRCDSVREYMDWMSRTFATCWHWQLSVTGRYTSDDSIFTK